MCSAAAVSLISPTATSSARTCRSTAGATFIGTFSQPGDGTLSIAFNGDASASDVDDVLRQITYTNTSDAPPASVVIDFTFGDGNGQPGGQDQGAGASPGTATGSVTVEITPVDDAPGLVNVAPAAAYGIGTAGTLLSPALGVFDVDTPTLASATISIADGSIATDQLFVNLTDDGSGHFITSDGETTSIAGAEQCIRHLDAGGSGPALALAIGSRCGLLQVHGRRSERWRFQHASHHHLDGQ